MKECNKLWSVFEKSGKLSDYLEYRKRKNSIESAIKAKELNPDYTQAP